MPVFKNGARGVEELKNRFDELGGGLSEGALGVLGETDQKLRENEVAIRSFKGALVSTFGPGVNKVLEKGTKWVAQLDKTEEGTAALKAGVLGLGVVAGGMALAAVGAFGAALGSAVAVTAEWFNILNGGPTIIGAVMEALGDKSAPQVMEDIASGWSRIVKDMREAKGLEGVLAVVGETAERKSQDLGRAFKSEELSGRLEELRRGRNREGREIGDLQEINDVALKLALDAKEHATRGTAFKGIGAQFKTAGLVKEARAINAVPDQLAQSAFAATAGISPFASLAAPLATAATAGATKEIRVDSKPSIQINQTVTVASVEEADALASATKDGALRGVTDGANAMHAALTTAAK